MSAGTSVSEKPATHRRRPQPLAARGGAMERLAADRFGSAAVLLVLLLAMLQTREITRPFDGLHNWAEASGAWAARTHARYGWGFTRGISTWAVGDPPVLASGDWTSDEPLPPHWGRYLDHPQLHVNLSGVLYRITGSTQTWVLRAWRAVFWAGALLMFLLLARRLVGAATALLAGVFFALFPLTAYFTSHGLFYLLAFLVTYCYLASLGELPGVTGRRRHAWGLGLGLFFLLQLAWMGLFVAMGLAVHYSAHVIWHGPRRREGSAALGGLWAAGLVLLAMGRSYWFLCFAAGFVLAGCWLVWQRRWGQLRMAALLTVAPGLSLLGVLVVMLAGYGWDASHIAALFTWRADSSGAPDDAGFDWAGWFARGGRHAWTNYTLPAGVLGGGYLVAACVRWVRRAWGRAAGEAGTGGRLGFGPGVVLGWMAFFQLFVLRGALWQHQTWLRPLTPIVAIAAALGVVWLCRGIAGRGWVRVSAGVALGLMAWFAVHSARGIDAYYSVRWSSPEKIAMLEGVREIVPPDGAVASFESFLVHEHPAKGAFYHPVVGWYLDRRIIHVGVVDDQGRPDVEATVERIGRLAGGGEATHCLAPLEVEALRDELQRRYERVATFPAADAGGDGPVDVPGAGGYGLWDLRTPPPGSGRVEP